MSEDPAKARTVSPGVLLEFSQRSTPRTTKPGSRDDRLYTGPLPRLGLGRPSGV